MQVSIFSADHLQLDLGVQVVFFEPSCGDKLLYVLDFNVAEQNYILRHKKLLNELFLHQPVDLHVIYPVPVLLCRAREMSSLNKCTVHIYPSCEI